MKLIILTIALWLAVGALTVRALAILDRQIEAAERI